MYTDSVSLEKQRLLKYKVYSQAFSYPDESFFNFFPSLKRERERVLSDYDQLFRKLGIWLYTVEYTAVGEFQKTQELSDIMGFYRAFGLEPQGNRPDAISLEFEFMHYLIFKGKYAIENNLEDFRLKAHICLDAQKKFFHDHLYAGASAIAEKITLRIKEGVYVDIVSEMNLFLDEEKRFFQNLGERGMGK